jgi:hypothetical protein
MVPAAGRVEVHELVGDPATETEAMPLAGPVRPTVR